jgi:TetR/AcrR family fatty acid metabolism transcriptional regulator
MRKAKEAAARGRSEPVKKRSKLGQTPTKGERTRARLIDVAIKEFSLRGFDRTKVSDIVLSAKLTQPTFYLYFSSKEALYNHLVAQVRQDLVRIVRRVRVPAHLDQQTAQAKIRAAIRAFFQYFVDNPKLATIGYFQAEASTAIRKEITTFIARNIAAEQSSGYLRRDLDAVFLSECYNGSLDRLIGRYLLTGEIGAAQLTEKVARVYLEGIRALMA